MKFRLTWRVKSTRKSGAGDWQAVREGIDAWCLALNASTDLISYHLEYAEGVSEPVQRGPIRNRFFLPDVERDGL